MRKSVNEGISICHVPAWDPIGAKGQGERVNAKGRIHQRKEIRCRSMSAKDTTGQERLPTPLGQNQLPRGECEQNGELRWVSLCSVHDVTDNNNLRELIIAECN